MGRARQPIRKKVERRSAQLPRQPRLFLAPQSSGRLRDISVRGCGLEDRLAARGGGTALFSSARPPSILLEVHHFARRAPGNHELRSPQKRLHHVAAQIIGAQKQVRALQRRPA